MTPIERLLVNTANYFSFLKEFTVGDAKDVSITHLEADGSESVKTFPNIAKFTASVAGSIRAESSKTIYVDNSITENTSTTFKTIKEAVESLPVNCFSTIYLKKGQTHLITDNIYTAGRVIKFQTHNISNVLEDNAWIENISYGSNETKGFYQQGGKISFYKVNLRTASLSDVNASLSIWEGLFKRDDMLGIKAVFYSSIIEISDTNLIRVASGSHTMTDLYFYSCQIKQIGNNRNGLILFSEIGNVSCSVSSVSIVLKDGTTGNMKDMIGGQIVRDLNGIPLNYVTNFDL